MQNNFDILGLGGTAIDEIFDVDVYPAADTKQRGLRRERRHGGVTAIALVAAARLGVRCAYAGALGDDPMATFVLRKLEEEGIDTSRVVRSPGVTPVRSFIVVARNPQTRNIFVDVSTHQGAADDGPPAEVIRSARVLLVDHYGVPGMIRAARIARDAGIPVVADLENNESPRFAELLALCDHLVISLDFAARLSNENDPQKTGRALLSETRRAVVLTGGEKGCWYIDAKGAFGHQPAFQVKVADTNGCGDVFHGAYAVGILRGLDLAGRVRLASAAAALKATRADGAAGVPHAAKVEALLGGAL